MISIDIAKKTTKWYTFTIFTFKSWTTKWWYGSRLHSKGFCLSFCAKLPIQYTLERLYYVRAPVYTENRADSGKKSLKSSILCSLFLLLLRALESHKYRRRRRLHEILCTYMGRKLARAGCDVYTEKRENIELWGQTLIFRV